MKKMIVLFFTIFVFSGIAVSEECEEMHEGSTRASACFAEREAQEIDKQLNESYDLLMKVFLRYGYSKDKLINAERAWIKYRDNECKLQSEVYGGINGVSSARCMSEMNGERLQKLKDYINTFDLSGL